MNTLLVTYAVAWAAIAVFALKLAVEDVRLERHMTQLKANDRETHATKEPSSRAA